MAMSTKASRSLNLMSASRSLGIVTVISLMKVAQMATFGKPRDRRLPPDFATGGTASETARTTTRMQSNVQTFEQPGSSFSFRYCQQELFIFLSRHLRSLPEGFTAPARVSSGHQNGHQTA